MDGFSSFFERTITAITKHHAYRSLLSEPSKEVESVELLSSNFSDDDLLSNTPRKNNAYLRSLSIAKFLSTSFLVFLLPSFVKNLWQPSEPTKVPATAYLNGLRGVAAFIVFCQHLTTDYYVGEPLLGYGSRPQDVWITQLPFIRLIYRGSFMIAIFFILSGYVL